jgi:hypothetical protein
MASYAEKQQSALAKALEVFDKANVKPSPTQETGNVTKRHYSPIRPNMKPAEEIGGLLPSEKGDLTKHSTVGSLSPRLQTLDKLAAKFKKNSWPTRSRIQALQKFLNDPKGENVSGEGILAEREKMAEIIRNVIRDDSTLQKWDMEEGWWGEGWDFLKKNNYDPTRREDQDRWVQGLSEKPGNENPMDWLV